MYKENIDGDQAIKTILESAEVISGLAPKTTPNYNSPNSIHGSNRNPKKGRKISQSKSLASQSSNLPINNALPAIRDPSTGKLRIPPNPHSKRQQKNSKMNVTKKKILSKKTGNESSDNTPHKETL